MKVNNLNMSEYYLWDKFVQESSQGSIFSYSWYLDALQVDYKILVIIEKEIIKAGIVLAKNEINTYSNPMLDKYLGVLFCKETGNQYKITSKQYKYMDVILSELKKIKSFDYYFHPNFKNWIPFHWNGFTQQTRYTYRISNNTKSIDEIHNSFHSNLKNDIKYAASKNITINQDIPLEIFYNVINKTFIRQGSKSPFNKKKIDSFISALKVQNRFKSFGAYNSNGICIAVCGLVYDKKSSYLILNGINIDSHIRGANTLMLFESIKYFHDKCDFFDFEGSMLPGVEQFYRRFGGELTPYMKIWNDNFFNYFKAKAKAMYKKFRYGR